MVVIALMFAAHYMAEIMRLLFWKKVQAKQRVAPKIYILRICGERATTSIKNTTSNAPKRLEEHLIYT
jgi:hypothetical protein